MRFKKFFAFLLIVSFFLSSTTLAHANEKEIWRFYYKHMTYTLESGLSSLMEKGWNKDQWNEKENND